MRYSIGKNRLGIVSEDADIRESSNKQMVSRSRRDDPGNTTTRTRESRKENANDPVNVNYNIRESNRETQTLNTRKTNTREHNPGKIVIDTRESRYVKSLLLMTPTIPAISLPTSIPVKP